MIRECEQDFEQLPHKTVPTPTISGLGRPRRRPRRLFNDIVDKSLLGKRPAGRFKSVGYRLSEILGGKGRVGCADSPSFG